LYAPPLDVVVVVVDAEDLKKADVPAEVDFALMRCQVPPKAAIP
jgi:hypothetical protein